MVFETMAAFSDILIEVRRLIWKDRYFSHVDENDELKEMPGMGDMDMILDQLADVV